MIRGGALRAASYAVGMVLGALTSVFLLRGLGVVDFGRYATVTALLAIVSTLSDAGLTVVGGRELSLRAREERAELMRDLVGLRLLLTLAALAAAVAFALLAGYDRVMVAGVLLGGLGVLLLHLQSTTMLPLSVELRNGRIAAVEVVRGAVTLAGVAALALAGASLLPYFLVQVLVGVVVLALTPLLLGSFSVLRASLTRARAVALLRDAAPIGVALALNVLYLRLLVLLVYVQTDEHETGLYATAFRVVELFVLVPPLVVGVALPLLAVAGAEDHDRLRYALQRLTEAVVVGALLLALVVTVVAEPALRLLGGGEEYTGAADMLRIQVWALVPLAVSSVLAMGLVSLHRQRSIAVANGIVVAVVLAAGIALVAAFQGEGAAAAGVVAEVVLVLALLVLLAAAAADVTPRFGFLWRPLLALGAGLATLLLPLPAWVDGAVAAAAFLAAALLVGALPREVLEALRGRAPGDRPA